MVRLRSFPRIHIGLLDLGHATHRDHGGAGFYVNGLPVEIEVFRSHKQRIVGIANLDKDGQEDLRAAIGRMRASLNLPGFTVHLRNVLAQHVGLGSKTAVILGVLKAIGLLFNLDVERQALQRLSGRGGTSGVGINVFFSGGFVTDGGHEASEARTYAPSSRRSHFDAPPIICRYRIPEDWRFHLVLAGGRRLSSQSEVIFFQQNTPVPAGEVLKSIATLYHGVAPAVCEDNLNLLKASLQELHSTGFKAREVRNQSNNVRRLMAELDNMPELAIGMSSLGPLVYAIGMADNHKGATLVRQIAAKYDAELLGVFRGRNQGYEIVK